MIKILKICERNCWTAKKAIRTLNENLTHHQENAEEKYDEVCTKLQTVSDIMSFGEFDIQDINEAFSRYGEHLLDVDDSVRTIEDDEINHPDKIPCYKTNIIGGTLNGKEI